MRERKMINITKNCFIIITVSVATIFATCINNRGQFDDYEVPEPKIEVFGKGFRVIIPDDEGIHLFAFHGNINVPMMYLEAGQFSRDILKKKENHWIFEDTHTKLQVGDVIYYWLFVIKFNRGYRYDDGKFVVKEILSKAVDDGHSNNSVVALSHTGSENNSSWHFEPLEQPSSPNNFQQISLPKPTESTELADVSNSSQPAEEYEGSTCCELFLSFSKQNSQMIKEIANLTEQVEILSDIAKKDEYYAQTLRVFGKYPSEHYPTPKDFVRNLISEQLQLDGIKVLSAKKIPDNGVSFKVETLQDKVKVISAAKKKLKGSNYDLQW